MTTTISPSLGTSPEWLQLGPGASASYGAIDLRRILGANLQEGVLGSTGGAYKVSLSSGMILTIAASTGDGACVQGDSVTAQGVYYVPPHSAAITETVTASHPTLPRIDQVVLEILDANHDGGASNLARVRIIAGTATAGATLDNRTGAASLPNSAIRLADVLVPAAASSIIAGNIRDRRGFARGAYNRILRNGGSYSVTVTTAALVDSTNLQPRIECSGVPLRVTARGILSSSGSLTISSQFFIDGAAVESTTAGGQGSSSFPGTSFNQPLALTYDFVPAAGSHLIGLAALVSSGTGTFNATAAFPLLFTVEEIVRQNASNT